MIHLLHKRVPKNVLSDDLIVCHDFTCQQGDPYMAAGMHKMTVTKYIVGFSFMTQLVR